MTSKSPFSLQRFEYERKHLYYLLEDTFRVLEKEMPIYIIGSRGTGKTTLLNALNWNERLSNESLRKALGAGDIFKNHYIGVYLRVSEFNVASFDSWLSSEKDIGGSIFGFYIDLIWVESVAIALSELVLTKDFRIEPSQEHVLCGRILDNHPEIGKLLPSPKECTFRTFAGLVRRVRQKLEAAAKKKIHPHHIIDDYPIGHIGDFGRSIGSYITDFLDSIDSEAEPHWHLKVCLDEAECLSPFQRLVLNTSIRLAKSHVFYVISFVDSLVDITRTLIPNMTLQQADRELINLDQMNDETFRSLAEGVANVRIDKLNPHCSLFDVDSVLGKLDINSLLMDILTVSESSIAKDLLKKAAELAREPFFEVDEEKSASEVINTRNSTSLPIYQAYIIKALDLIVPEPHDPKWRRRAQESRELRKKMVAAYLCICKELNTEAHYAYAEMVLQMSDKCIRDFLRQVDGIYRESGLSLETFVESRVHVAKQNIALRRASESKKESIRQSGVTAPLEIARIIDGLARITAIIQSGPTTKALKSSERGNFVITAKTDEVITYSNTFELIKEACEAGFLKMIESTGRKWRFRVHTSLAAFYCFSYRGAYYDTHLRITDIESLQTTKDPDEFNKTVHQIAKRLSGAADYPLFEGTEQ